MDNKKIKYTTRIFYAVATFLLIGITISFIYGWYTSTSNDATFDSTEFKTVSQGYAGHFSTEEEYAHLISNIYENDDTMITQTTVAPGTIVYYAVMFDVSDYASIEAKYQIDNLLVYGSNSTVNYHGKTVGDYYSFMYNTGVEANSCHLFLMKKINDSTSGVGYTRVGTDYYTVNSTLVSRLSDSKTSPANVSFSLQITMPTISQSAIEANYDGSDNVYFMLYIPICYQDIEENQNEEMDSYIKIASTVVVPVE